MAESPTEGEAEPCSRLMIKQIVLENFKSYGGRKVIGPFHKCFSAVVGPNGSGKSNVIDALLFAFGKRAKKLRLSKVSELIHKSDSLPDCKSARVDVFFQCIIDEDSGFKVVPGSDFTISREAFRNNSSKYFYNDKTSSFGEVTTLLRKYGVDLDNNRFLILQGEVEQIALMKPKATTPHEEGLLEYLEDIIGTKKYVKSIEESGGKVSELSDVREEHLKRVAMVGREKDSLEGAKLEAEELQTKELAIARTQGDITQLEFSSLSAALEECKAKHATMLEELDRHKAVVAEKDQESRALEERHSGAAAECEQGQAELEKCKADFTSFERKDIEYRANRKHVKQTIKKLEKLIKSSQASAEKQQEAIASLEEDIPALEKEVEKLHQQRAEADAAVEEIYDSLQEVLNELRGQLESKQKELSPLAEAVSEAEANMGTTMAELQLLEEKAKETEMELSQVKDQARDTTVELQKATKNRQKTVHALKTVKGEVAQIEDDLAGLCEGEQLEQNQLLEVQCKLEEKKEDLSKVANQGVLLQTLMEACASDGPLEGCGLLGRLGSLGAIASKYDVAVTTGCGYLNHLIVEKKRDARVLVEFLHRNRLGRAKFIVLEQLEWIRSALEKPFSPPPGCKRLLDLVRLQDETLRIAFFFALRNTLVVDTLDNAVKVAYKGDRAVFRVVTLGGELIETSGTMSGGGGKPKTGGMGSSLGAAKTTKAQAEKEIRSLMAMAEKLEGRVKEMGERRSSLEAELEVKRKLIPDCELAASKLNITIPMLEKRLLELKERLGMLETRVAGGGEVLSAAERRRVVELEKLLVAQRKTCEKAQSRKERVQVVVDSVQQKIDTAGGKKLVKAKAAAESSVGAVQDAEKALAKAKVSLKTAIRNKSKAEAKAEKAETDVAQNREDLQALCDDFKEIEDKARGVMEAYEDIKVAVKTKLKALRAIAKEYDAVRGEVEDLKGREVELQDGLADVTKALRKLTSAHSDCSGRLATVAARYRSAAADVIASRTYGQEAPPAAVVVESPEAEEEEEEEEEGRTGDISLLPPKEMVMLDQKQLDKLDMGELESDLQLLNQERDALRAKVNMGAIEEYREKERQYLDRVAELDAVTQERNAARKEYDVLRKRRLEEFMAGFSTITLKLKEMYQMITMGGDAELELVDSLDPFNEGVTFSVRPPRKSWKNISNLSGGEKTLSSLALVFALHHYKPTPLYVMDEIDAALDFKNVSVVANYIQERTRNAQFVIISLRNNMFELADRLIGIYKTENITKSVSIQPSQIATG